MSRTMTGTSKIRNILGPEAGAWAYQGGSTLCLGQLKTLFGEPLYVKKNLEDQYAYCILAAGEDGKEIYLQVYSGPTGPAIGGEQDADSARAADALAELITSAKAADYDYEGYYMDGPCIVREGVRGGAPGIFSRSAMIFKSFVTSQENFCKIYCLYSYSQGKNIFSFYPPFFERLTGRSVGLSLCLEACLNLPKGPAPLQNFLDDLILL